jgi:hypothetical protein
MDDIDLHFRFLDYRTERYIQLAPVLELLRFLGHPTAAAELADAGDEALNRRKPKRKWVIG